MAPTTLENDIAKIIKALGRAFREEARPDVASILSEARVGFRETSYDNWNGGTHGYTVQLEVPARIYARLGEAGENLESELKSRVEKFIKVYPNEFIDEVLVVPDLEESDSEDSVVEHAVKPPSFWKEGSLRLFLSHASEFKVEASSLAENLSSYGVSAFVAHEQIEPTKEWEDEIRLGLTTCDAFACLLTQEFKSSDWTDQEVGFAINRRVLVIPIRLGLDPYGFMARYQGYSGIGKKPQELARDLVMILAKHERTRDKMAEVLVSVFTGSNSFAEAKATAKNLVLIEAWSKVLIETARLALKDNDQIEGAWGVSASVEKMLSTISPTG
jgi:hypothetical protein